MQGAKITHVREAMLVGPDLTLPEFITVTLEPILEF
jgi:hypothetical protein